MNMKMIFKFNLRLFTCLIPWAVPILLQAQLANADRRAFAHTYEYMTIPAQDLELEFYNTESRTTFGSGSPRNFEQQIEIEYGITSRWDISLYQVFRQSTNPDAPDMSSPLGYAKTKVRSRYRLGERGQSIVDTLLYLELQKTYEKDEFAIEPKLVFGRDFGKFTGALNLIPEIEIEEDATTGKRKKELKLKPSWAAGVTYEFSPALKVGGEWFGNLDIDGNNNDISMWAGPSVSWAPSNKLWATVNAAFGVTGDAAEDNFRLRFILGLGI